MGNLVEKTHFMMLQNELAFGQPGYIVAEAAGCEVFVRIRDDYTTEVEQHLDGDRKKFFWFDGEGRLIAERKTTNGDVTKEMQMTYEGNNPDSKMTTTYTTGKSSHGNEVEITTVEEFLTSSKAVAAYRARAVVISDPLAVPDIKENCGIFGQDILLGKGK